MDSKLSEMNLYLLYEIFEYMDREGLVHLYDTDTNLRYAVSRFVQIKSARKAYKITAYDVDPEINTSIF